MITKLNKKLITQYLCIDTNILIQCCFLEIDGDDLKVLKNLLKLLNENKVKLLLPEIIKLEFFKRFKSKKNILIGEISRHKENIGNSGGLNQKPKEELKQMFDKYIATKEELSEKAKKIIKLIFNHKNTIQKGLEITPEIFIETYKSFFTQEKPFNKDTRNEKERPDIIQADCIVIESLKKFLSSQGTYKLYLCSQNTTDFANDPLKSPMDVHEDIKNKFHHIELSNNLGILLKDQFKISVSKKVIRKLSTGKTDKDDEIVGEPNQQKTI